MHNDFEYYRVFFVIRNISLLIMKHHMWFACGMPMSFHLLKYVFLSIIPKRVSNLWYLVLIFYDWLKTIFCVNNKSSLLPLCDVLSHFNSDFCMYNGIFKLVFNGNLLVMKKN